VFEHLLEVFEPLLEFVHLGSVVHLSLLPPGCHQVLEIGVGEPEFLELEGFERGGGFCCDLEGYFPVI
jgi:hypothetical protein